jgi:integrase
VRLLHAKNEAHQQPLINLQIARAYLTASDPQIAKRTWNDVMQAMVEQRSGKNRERWKRAVLDQAFDSLRPLLLLETRPEHFLRALKEGTVTTNVFLRRIQNFAIDMTWLPWPILNKKQWPKIVFGEKRAITETEHEKILAREPNADRKAYYQLCSHLGGSQADIANLTAEDIDWTDRTISYRRKKTKTPALVHFGDTVAASSDGRVSGETCNSKPFRNQFSESARKRSNGGTSPSHAE